MKELFSLGKLNISDFLSIDNNTEQKKYELKLILDENGAVRLNECAPLDSMYGKYWYRSGINQTMRAELKSIVDSIVKVSNFSPNDVWIDIACNDGTMFEFIPDDIIKIGIDPADDSYFNESKKKANLVIQDFFTEESYSNISKLENNWWTYKSDYEKTFEYWSGSQSDANVILMSSTFSFYNEYSNNFPYELNISNVVTNIDDLLKLAPGITYSGTTYSSRFDIVNNFIRTLDQFFSHMIFNVIE